MRRFLMLGLVVLVCATGSTAAMAGRSGGGASARHVLLLSVDGLHQSDLTWYVDQHPSSALAKLVHRGVEFTHALTPFPSDSFPGMVGQITGGNPKTTGVYYDDTWNRRLLPADTTHCASVTPGVEVTYFEQADRDPTSLDAGQGLAGLPDSILQMTGDAASLIDPTQLPVDPLTCTPVYPHQYLQVNTIFEVARAAGLRTAWSDKHLAYEILNGPSGTGVQDLFAPEINSDAPTSGASNDWTTDNALTMQYDSYKVQAVLNEINGFDHSGTVAVGTPAIFGMNFQPSQQQRSCPPRTASPAVTSRTDRRRDRCCSARSTSSTQKWERCSTRFEPGSSRTGRSSSCPRSTASRHKHRRRSPVSPTGRSSTP